MHANILSHSFAFFRVGSIWPTEPSDASRRPRWVLLLLHTSAVHSPACSVLHEHALHASSSSDHAAQQLRIRCRRRALATCPCTMHPVGLPTPRPRAWHLADHLPRRSPWLGVHGRRGRRAAASDRRAATVNATSRGQGHSAGLHGPESRGMLEPLHVPITGTHTGAV